MTQLEWWLLCTSADHMYRIVKAATEGISKAHQQIGFRQKNLNPAAVQHTDIGKVPQLQQPEAIGTIAQYHRGSCEDPRQ